MTRYISIDINQGKRDGIILTEDEIAGAYLVEYTMPKGTTALRIMYQNPKMQDRSIAYTSLSRRWQLLLLLDKVQWDCEPQKGKLVRDSGYIGNVQPEDLFDAFSVQEMDAYMNGWDAFLMSKQESDNPYKATSANSVMWQRGYDDCKFFLPLPSWYNKWIASKKDA